MNGGWDGGGGGRKDGCRFENLVSRIGNTIVLVYNSRAKEKTVYILRKRKN